ncbi:hypothetical protein, partial [Agrobacterium tumefaciens]|uniref:hypothetical protein n=1 Tax=Agrobacterium tumefaciens TaxID=358 RepID=UPI001B8A7C9A
EVQTSLFVPLSYGPSIPLVTRRLPMSRKNHHQRRRRGFNWVWLFKLITLLGQVILYFLKYWNGDD